MSAIARIVFAESLLLFLSRVVLARACSDGSARVRVESKTAMMCWRRKRLQSSFSQVCHSSLSL